MTSSLKPADIILRVQFKEFKQGLTTAELGLGSAKHSEVFLKQSDLAALSTKEIIRVNKGGSILRLSIEPDSPSGSPRETYRPIGICFERVDPVTPRAVPPSAPGSPFSDIRITANGLEFKDTPVKGQKTDKGELFRTFKFWVTVQRDSDGAIGIIDPEIENENPA